VDIFSRWRHEVRSARIVVVAANPVLAVADRAGVLGVRAVPQQAGVDRPDPGHGDVAGLGSFFDGQLHSVDVRDDLQRTRSHFTARFDARFRTRQLAGANLHSFDFR